MKLFNFSKWTRRKFLKASLASSIFIGNGNARVKFSPTAAAEPESGKTTGVFKPRERDLLRAVMDQIIPRGDGMPAASEVGGVNYLDRLAQKDEEISRRLRGCLDAVETLSVKKFGNPFVSLAGDEQVEVLRGMESSEPTVASFAALREYVYEAYYTQPEVWKLLGYDFHATNESGPAMKPFDENALAQVRRKPKYFREVS